MNPFCWNSNSCSSDKAYVHSQQDISIVRSRSLLLRSAVWEVYGNRSLCRESLLEHMYLSGKCDAEAMCSAYCRLALLEDDDRSSSSSSHTRSLRMILRTSFLWCFFYFYNYPLWDRRIERTNTPRQQIKCRNAWTVPTCTKRTGLGMASCTLPCSLSTILT